VMTTFELYAAYVKHIRHALSYWFTPLDCIRLAEIINRLTFVEQMQRESLFNVDPSSQIIWDFDALLFGFPF